MIYFATLYTATGEIKDVKKRPSKKFLLDHPQYVGLTENGYYNEHSYMTAYEIKDGELIEISDSEQHEREYSYF